MKKVLHLLVILLFAGALNAQDLIRGPYQQSATTHSVKVMWRTSELADGWVKVGDTPESLDRVFTGESAIDHMIEVTGLEPYTKYYYAVGHGDDTLASGIDHYILTNRPYGDTTKFSLWAIGDFGKANEPQRMARNAFHEYHKTNPVDFMITLGDNAYQNGEDSEYQEKVFSRDYGYDSIFRFLHYYPTPGNHDYNIIRGENLLDWIDPTLDEGPYFDIHEMPRNGEAGGVPSGTELYYSYDYGHVHFISFNSELYTWLTSNWSPIKGWLRKDLAENKLPWVVVYFHQPPYTMGSHVSDDFYEIPMLSMRRNIMPILEQAGVDFIIAGHSHVYERSYMVNGHYGKMYSFDPEKHLKDGSSGNPDAGEGYKKNELREQSSLYVVVGNSGSYTSDDKLPVEMHPVHYFRDGGSDVTGSLVLEFDGGTATGKYINKYGDILDKFSIQKEIGEIEIPTSVKENYVDLYEMNAFPNPSSDRLTLEFNNPTLAKASIAVTDMSGKQVILQENTVNGSATVGIDGWSQLPAGTYAVTLNISNKIGTINVVKSE